MRVTKVVIDRGRNHNSLYSLSPGQLPFTVRWRFEIHLENVKDDQGCVETVEMDLPCAENPQNAITEAVKIAENNLTTYPREFVRDRYIDVWQCTKVG